MQTKLDPAGIRSLARRLCGEAQFKADPVGSVLIAVRWLDEVIGNEEGQESSRSLDTEIIARLKLVVREQGLDTVAKGIGVSVNAIKTWLLGAQPNPANLGKLKEYLEGGSQAPSPDAAGVAKPGELFGQPQLGQPQSPEPES